MHHLKPRGVQRPEMMVHADRFHGLAQTGEIPLDAQRSHMPNVTERERLGEPLEGPAVPGYSPGRAVADAPAEEESLESGLEAGFGVSICFLGLFWRSKIAASRDLIGLERETGLEPATLCLGSRCSTN